MSIPTDGSSEQPLRVALWYGMNGIASIMAAIFAYAL